MTESGVALGDGGPPASDETLPLVVLKAEEPLPTRNESAAADDAASDDDAIGVDVAAPLLPLNKLLRSALDSELSCCNDHTKT